MKNTTDKVTLYITTHNKTGKKYFGKTTRYFTQEDLQSKYQGSGTYWKRHLKKHGDNVTMEIYGIYDIDEVKEVALQFSKENNIVESHNWANLKEENGLDSGLEKHTDKTKKKISNITKGKMNPFYGKRHTKESILKISKAAKGRICSEITRNKLSEKQKGKNTWSKGRTFTQNKLTCPHCKKEGGATGMKRWHFNNCKLKRN